MANQFYLNNVTGFIDVEAFVKSLTQAKQKELQKNRSRQGFTPS
jgi:predicted N-acyltransferase